MNFYNTTHLHYCGIDLHARSLYVCIIDHEGKTLLHKEIPANPEPLYQLIEPYRDDLIMGVECMHCWYWVADFCEDHGIHFILGHALYMKAIHGGKTKNDRIDSYKIAKLMRGGNFPLAYERCGPHEIYCGNGHVLSATGLILKHISLTRRANTTDHRIK